MTPFCGGDKRGDSLFFSFSLFFLQPFMVVISENHVGLEKLFQTPAFHTVRLAKPGASQRPWPSRWGAWLGKSLSDTLLIYSAGTRDAAREAAEILRKLLKGLLASRAGSDITKHKSAFSLQTRLKKTGTGCRADSMLEVRTRNSLPPSRGPSLRTGASVLIIVPDPPCTQTPRHVP